MSGWRVWDYQCRRCGRVYQDQMFRDSIPESIRCTCGQKATWARQRVNYIHPTHSGRKYGQFDPQIGCVVESYDHKRRLLREHGLIELPPEPLEKAMEEPMNTGSTAARNPDVIVADDMDELQALIPRDRIDWRQSGPKRDNLDYWGGFRETDSE